MKKYLQFLGLFLIAYVIIVSLFIIEYRVMVNSLKQAIEQTEAR